MSLDVSPQARVGRVFQGGPTRPQSRVWNRSPCTARQDPA